MKVFKEELMSDAYIAENYLHLTAVCKVPNVEFSNQDLTGLHTVLAI